ncbi:hypothetical protein [Actinoplanes flavus]|uniref:Uncharacterized protein n=1 Tax=Actinoplanes flavus TaxID=2820290 RepID=A0ABS3UM61_9ACTN|nr:hypothetical protein [Actinoplanes flavus]MBO3739541.1 hypothetical protein [Actinoplanes flavus]
MTASLAERRQAGLTALYLGVFAMIWFSVPDSRPPLGTYLVVGSLTSILVAGIGALVVLRAHREGPVERNTSTDRRYLVIFAGELAAAGFGAVLLAVIHRSEYIPVLVGVIVGLHFLPLAPVLKDPALRVLGVAVCLAGLAGLIAGLVSEVAPARVTASGIGVLLLGYAIGALIRIVVGRPGR